MATLPNGQPTLADVSAQFGSDGKPLPLAELLHKTNPGFNDIPFVEANSQTGHKTSARQALPETFLRRINQGIAPTKSSYGTVMESAGLFAAMGQVDRKLLDLAGDKARFRMNENRGHIESMGQKFFTTLLYGDPLVTPEEFLGIAPRYDSLATAQSTAVQIIDAGGNDTDLTSIYLVGWGEGSVQAFYPKGSKAGIIHTPYEERLVTDEDGLQYPAVQDWFELDAGLAVEDYRNIVRIANIDISLLEADASAGADLINLMVMALESLNNREGLNPVFYVPRVVSSYLRMQITNKSNVWLSTGEVAGQKVTSFDNATVRRMDAILLNESRVTT
jgi:hypothetical protein